MSSQTHPTGIERMDGGRAFVIACRSVRVGWRAALTAAADANVLQTRAIKVAAFFITITVRGSSRKRQIPEG
jgi:hypothetical protein